jgi:hypothetical protein
MGCRTQKALTYFLIINIATQQIYRVIQFKRQGHNKGLQNTKSPDVLSYYIHLYLTDRSRDSSVGIATGYGLDDRGVGVKRPCKVKNFLFSTSPRPALGCTQPPSQWVPGALSPGVKRPGREAVHSLPPSVEVKKIWIYTSTPPYAFMA